MNCVRSRRRLERMYVQLELFNRIFQGWIRFYFPPLSLGLFGIGDHNALRHYPFHATSFHHLHHFPLRSGDCIDPDILAKLRHDSCKYRIGGRLGSVVATTCTVFDAEDKERESGIDEEGKSSETSYVSHWAQ